MPCSVIKSTWHLLKHWLPRCHARHSPHTALVFGGVSAASGSPAQSTSSLSVQLQPCGEASLYQLLAVQAWAIVQQYTAPVLRAVPLLNAPVRYVSRWFMPPQ